MRVASLLALLACGQPIAVKVTPPPPPSDAAIAMTPDAPPTPLDQDLPRLAASALAMQRDVARALGAADCATTTAQLLELRARYAEVAIANAKVMRDGRALDLRHAVEAHQGDFDAAARAIAEAPALARCAADHAFVAALDGVGEPPP